MKWLKDWDETIFGYGSVLPMAVFRAFVGFLSFLNVLIYAGVFADFFTEKGLFPVWMSERYAEGIPRLNLLAGVTDDRVTWVMLGLTGLASLLVVVGFATRISTIGLFVLLLTLHHRSGDVLHAGDWLLRLWIFSLAVSSCGAVFSVDRWLAVRKGAGSVEEVSLWPQRLVQFQLAIVYFMTVWLKWGGDLWRNGTATWYAENLNEFVRFPVPGFMHSIPAIKVATYGTLLVELAMATLVFHKPIRKWVMLAALAMHAYIEYSMNIPLFEWVIVAAFVCHFSGEEILSWARRVSHRPGFRTLASRGLWPSEVAHA